MLYASVEDVKQRIGYLPASNFGFSSEAAFESYIQILIRGASRLIDAECNVKDGEFAENTPDLIRNIAADAVAIFLMKAQKFLQNRENPPSLMLLPEQRDALKRYKTFKFERG
jgi:hypothetical protein